MFYAHYTVCEGNSLSTACRFALYKDFSRVDLSNKKEVTCSWEQRLASSSVVALDIYITQVVTRSLSAMIVSTGRSGIPKPTRLIRVEVLYPPEVTSLTVGGEDFTSPYFINEGQKVDIFCSFDKGNPPATFKLLDKHGHELKSGSDGFLNYSLSAQCEDDRPTVRCEGSGSKQNRSVTFFVRCPPQFVENSINIVNLQTFQVLTFHVKAHTTTLTACLLTPVTLDNNVTRGVSCILSGHPPDLLLTVHLHKETNISEGNWSLILRNEIGSATTTLMITYYPGKHTCYLQSS
ncbi:uncharacterized protein LOC112569676 isoform X2 [Pomacea canaliculata]|nr:uncharacterized protein LOC112569676 isoform X2 [Pomacea canaliculata]